MSRRLARPRLLLLKAAAVAVATMLLVGPIFAVCIYRGESYHFLLCCSAVVLVACASTYIEARRVRQLADDSSEIRCLTRRSIAGWCRRPGQDP